jgi:hypothetical protein
MFETIFLTYANYNLKKNPKILLKIYDEFINSDLIEKQNQALFFRQVLRYFIIFAKIDDLKKAQKILRKKGFLKKILSEVGVIKKKEIK